MTGGHHQGHDPARLPAELIVVGLIILVVAFGLSAVNCEAAINRRSTEVSFNALVCPATPTGTMGPAPAWAFLFSRLFVLWLLGAGTLIAGVALGVRNRIRRKPPPPTSPKPEKTQGPKPTPVPPSASDRPAVRATFGTAVRGGTEDPMAALRAELRAAIGRGDLDGAVALAETSVAESGDDELMAAARESSADLDWIEVIAAAIEADVELKRIGEAGCRAVVLGLGSLDENRLSIGLNLLAPALSPEADRGRPQGRRAPSRDRAYRPLRLDGLAPLAQIERRPVWSADQEEWARNVRASALAGMLIVLRFLAAVRRKASETGLPFPVELHAMVDMVGGEDAIRQRDPFLSLDLDCRIAGIGPDVVERLAQRRERQRDRWQFDSETSLTHFRKEYERTGYVHSRFIPTSSPAYERFNALERRLAIYEPENRVSAAEFDRIEAGVAAAMAEEFPPPIDPAPYLSGGAS